MRGTVWEKRMVCRKRKGPAVGWTLRGRELQGDGAKDAPDLLGPAAPG